MARLTAEDFKARVQREPSGCWVWTGPQMPRRRHGLAILDGERLTARQVAWYHAHGTLPSVRLLPTCGEAGCINPEHQRRGIGPDDVPAILEAAERGENQRAIAARYGCTREHLCRLINRHRAGKEHAHAAS